MNETIEAMARAMVEAKVFSATGGCDGGAGPRHGVLGKRRQPGRQGGCGGGCRGESGSGSEGGGGGVAGGGFGGKIGDITATSSCVAARPRSAASVLAMLLAVRLVESVCASAAPPGWTTVSCAESVSSVEEVRFAEVGSGTAAIDGVVPVTWRSTFTCTLPLSN